MMGTNSVRGYAPQFYGGAVVPRESGVIEVNAGQDRAVEFRLTMHAGSTIAGRILWPESAQSFAGGGMPSISLLDESRRDLMPRILGLAVVQNEGQFEIRNVRPGKYVVRAQTGDDWAKAGNFLVEQEVQVDDGDVTDLVLPLHLVEPAELSGTVVLENGTSPGPLDITLSRNGSDIPFGGAISNDDGTFVLKGLLPGHYSIMVMPDLRSPRVAPDDQGRVYPYRGVIRARREHVLLVSAYLGDKDVMKEGFFFDGIVIGTLRLTVRLLQ
jgi:hypothetical protein